MKGRAFNPNYIVCAAMKMDDGLIVTGIRHYSPDMRATLKRIYGEMYAKHEVEQGFITVMGKFVDSMEALILCLDNNQEIMDIGVDNGELYSENLY